MANELGLRNVSFQVDDLKGVVDELPVRVLADAADTPVPVHSVSHAT